MEQFVRTGESYFHQLNRVSASLQALFVALSASRALWRVLLHVRGCVRAYVCAWVYLCLTTYCEFVKVHVRVRRSWSVRCCMRAAARMHALVRVFFEGCEIAPNDSGMSLQGSVLSPRASSEYQGRRTSVITDLSTLNVV
jgi:hypothetical protein